MTQKTSVTNYISNISKNDGESLVDTNGKIGETVDLSTQEWQPYNKEKSFILSSAVGTKTIYTQIKNETKESCISLSAIELKEAINMPEDGSKIIISIANSNSDIEYERSNNEIINYLNPFKSSINLKKQFR